MMIEIAWPPGLLIIAAAVPALLFRGSARAALLLALPTLALILVWVATPGASATVEFFGYSLQLFESTGLGRLFATVFIFALLAGHVFALRQASSFELACACLYAGSAVCVTLVGDFLSLFVFWEMMTLASSGVIFSANTHPARGAALRYLLLHLLGGMSLLGGILGMAAATGDIALRPLRAHDAYTWMMLAGFLIGAGAPPFSAWVADAYPEASPSGTVYLSAFKTKAAVFALLATFPGEAVLIPIGVYMIFYGIIYALNENDMRRILAYSIVNQVGFMLVGVGVGTSLALNGAAAHAATHIVYKALLLMSAGSVLLMTGERKCTDLGGLYHSMRLTTACGIIGALSISGVPLTSGFVSKPMVIDAALTQHAVWLWFALLAASAGVFLHAGIKFPWFVFFQKDSGLRPDDPPWNMRLAMLVLAACCLLVGLFPQWLYALLPWFPEYRPYTGSHVVTQLQLLVFSAIAFFMLLPWLQRSRTISLDFDWLYRRGGARLCSLLPDRLTAPEWLHRAGLHLASRLKTAGAPIEELQSGPAIRWMIALLALFLLLYYL